MENQNLERTIHTKIGIAIYFLATFVFSEITIFYQSMRRNESFFDYLKENFFTMPSWGFLLLFLVLACIYQFKKQRSILDCIVNHVSFVCR